MMHTKPASFDEVRNGEVLPKFAVLSVQQPFAASVSQSATWSLKVQAIAISPPARDKGQKGSPCSPCTC